MAETCVYMRARWFLTSAGPGVGGISSTLTHSTQELVNLLEGQRVVQRLQRVDRGHHGAAFKTCKRRRRRRKRRHRARRLVSFGWPGVVVMVEWAEPPAPPRLLLVCKSATHCTLPLSRPSISPRHACPFPFQSARAVVNTCNPCTTPTGGDVTPTRAAHTHTANSFGRHFAKAEQEEEKKKKKEKEE